MNDNKLLDVTKLLKEYWEDKKIGAPFPEVSDISGSEIEDIWANCFIIAAKPDGGFAYEYAGENVAKAYEYEMEGQDIVDDMLYPESPELITKLTEVTKKPEPLEYEGAFISRENEDIKFRKILLPLSTDGEIKYILGGMIWRSF